MFVEGGGTRHILFVAVGIEAQGGWSATNLSCSVLGSYFVLNILTY